MRFASARSVTLTCAVALAACTTFLGGGGRQSVEFNAPVLPDTALRIAITQLQLLGFQVGLDEHGIVVTHARPVPGDAAGPGGAVRLWLVRVEAEQIAATADSRVRVTGYLLPESEHLPAPGDTVPTTPITADNRRLFAELESIGRQIRDAARRHARGGQ
jgi:hypothetical protein